MVVARDFVLGCIPFVGKGRKGKASRPAVVHAGNLSRTEVARGVRRVKRAVPGNVRLHTVGPCDAAKARRTGVTGGSGNIAKPWVATTFTAGGEGNLIERVIDVAYSQARWIMHSYAIPFCIKVIIEFEHACR